MLLILLRAAVLLYSTPFYLDKHKPRAVSQIEKYYPQTSRQVLKKVELMMKHQPYQIRNPRFEDDGEGGESNRAEKEEERETETQRRTETGTSVERSEEDRLHADLRRTHGSSDIPRLSPSG